MVIGWSSFLHVGYSRELVLRVTGVAAARVLTSAADRVLSVELFTHNSCILSCDGSYFFFSFPLTWVVFATSWFFWLLVFPAEILVLGSALDFTLHVTGQTLGEQGTETVTALIPFVVVSFCALHQPEFSRTFTVIQSSRRAWFQFRFGSLSEMSHISPWSLISPLQPSPLECLMSLRCYFCLSSIP